MRALLVIIAVLAAVSAAGAQDKKPFTLFTDEKSAKVYKLAADGSILWEHPAAIARDVWQLPNGNVLFPYNDQYDGKKSDNPSGVMEVSPDHKVVFHFKTTGQVFSCQRMADGNTLVGAASQGKLLIVNSKGQIVKEIKVANAPGHSCMRNARALENGHFLVAEENAKAAREYDGDGKLVQEFKVTFPVYSAIRLKDGDTLLCGLKSMARFNAKGEKTWSMEATELPADLGIRWFAGLQVLPSGNLFICNAGGKVPLIEITNQKKVVWQSGVWETKLGMGHGIHRLDVQSAQK